MKRFLSVDWDYFIDATAEQRILLFPDGGNENLPESVKSFIWDACYRNPELKKIGVLKKDYDILKSILKKYYGHTMITDSHKHIYQYIMDNTEPDEEFIIYNIDFHHDFYNYMTRGERVNCGNWGTILKEERPNMKVVWVKREDSDTKTIGDYEVELETIEGIQNFLYESLRAEYDGIDNVFMCRSSVWSPPHLDDKFVEVVKDLLRHSGVSYQVGIDEPRDYHVEG